MADSSHGSAHYVSPGWYLLSLAVTVAWAGIVVPFDNLVSVIESASAYLFAGLFVGPLRFRRDKWVSPINWILAGWAIQLVVLPTLVLGLGPTSGSIAVMPEDSTINDALALQTAAFCFFALGIWFSTRPASPASSNSKTRALRSDGRSIGLAMIGCISLGAIGIIARFGTPQGVLQYLSGEAALQPLFPDGLRSIAAAILPPFLAVAGVLLFCQALDRQRGRATTFVYSGVAGGLILLGAGVFNYNRSGVAVFLLTLCVIWAAVRDRGTLLWWAVVFGLGLFVLLQVGSYRTEYFATEGGRFTREEAALEDSSVRETVEAYMRAPQYTAVALEGMRAGHIATNSLYMRNDVLSPLPVVGQSYRNETTSIAFSYAVRQQRSVADTAPPLFLELYMAAGLPITAVGMTLFGAAIGIVQRRFDAATTKLQLANWTILGIYCGYLLVGSMQFFLQMLLYFWLPVWIVYGLLAHRRHAVAEAPEPERVSS